MYALGFDIGSSSIKAAILNLESGKVEAAAFSPKNEMPITAVRAGWAEQDPNMWWENLKLATTEVLASVPYTRNQIIAVGVSYQMHGLVVVDNRSRFSFLSQIFCDTLANTAGITIELYNTNGAQGAARGAALGIKHFTSRSEMFKGLECIKVIEPQKTRANDYHEIYTSWSSALKRYL